MNPLLVKGRKSNVSAGCKHVNIVYALRGVVNLDIKWWILFTSIGAYA